MGPARNQGFRLRYTHNGKVVTVAVDKDRAVLGRDTSCNVVIPFGSAGVSRRHATILETEQGWSIQDLGSRNGTLVDGVSVNVCLLRDGAVVALGDFEFTFRVGPVKPSFAERVQFDDVSSPTAFASINANDFDTVLRECSGPLAAAAAAQAPAGVPTRGGDGWSSLGLFTQVIHALLGGEDLDRILEKILDLVFHNIPAAHGLLCLYDAPTDTITPKVARARDEDDEETISISRSIAREVIQSKKALLVRDTLSDQRFQEAASIVSMGIRSAMCAPLYNEGNVSGFIYADTYDPARPFREEHLQVLTVLAVLSAVGIEQARLREDIRREQQIRARLSRYSSPNVVEKIVKEAGTATADMGAEERDVSVLFSDLCGFTTLSERLTPAEVARTLNEIFDYLVDLVFRYEGTLDKYTGDGLIAVFGAPVHQPDHAERAVRTALLMHQEIARLNGMHPGRPPLAMRIGVNSGPVVAGDLGSPKRKDYTVIGDTVNVASRLESLVAKAGQVVIGSTTFEKVKDNFVCIALPATQLKGKDRLVQPYLVTGAVGEVKETVRIK